MDNLQTTPFDQSSQVFRGIRFLLLGFDPIIKSQVARKLVSSGGIDAGVYENCTHVIVDKITYDDPVCVAARRDGKTVVSGLWVEHSFDLGSTVDSTSVMYRPLKDLNGIPGAKSLVFCLTGYQREDREDIMTMVDQMGALFSKPLVANKVTHLICYKFEGEKYLLAKKMKRIKLINHKWLEDCLRAWEIIPEADYCKSGYELEMEAEAKDSEEEPEGRTTRHNDGILATPNRSLLSKQEVSKTVSNTSASRGLFSKAENSVSATMKSTFDQFPSPHEPKSNTKNVISAVSEPSNLFEKIASGSGVQKSPRKASIVANKSPQNDVRNVLSASSSLQTPIRTTPSKIDMKSKTGSAKRLNKFNFSAAFNMSNSLVEKETNKAPAFSVEEEQYGSPSGKRKINASSGTTKLQKTSHHEDISNRKSPHVEIAFQELNKDPPNENTNFLSPGTYISPVQNPAAKGKNVICDVPVSKISTSEIVEGEEDFEKVENLMKGFEKSSSSAISSDHKKSSTSNMEINEQSNGSNPKPVTKKSAGKKFLAPKQNLAKKKTMSQKGSIFSKNSELVNDATTSTVEIVSSVNNGLQIDNVCMDDETEPPEDKEDGNKEKHVIDEPENTDDIVVEEKAESYQDNDEDAFMFVKRDVPVDKSDKNDNLTSDKTSRGKKSPLTKKGKKNAADMVMEEKTEGGLIHAAYQYNDEDDFMFIERNVTVGKSEKNDNLTSDKTSRGKKSPLTKKGKKNTADIVMEEKTEGGLIHDVYQNNDEDNFMFIKKNVPLDKSVENENLTSENTSRGKKSPLTKKGKKKTATSVKEVTDKKAAKKKELEGVDDNKKLDIQEEATPQGAGKTKKNVTDLDKSMEVKEAEGVCNNPENMNGEKEDVGTEMGTKNVSGDIFDFTENLVTDKTSGGKTKKGKGRTALSVKKVNDKKASRKKQLASNDNNEKQETREEATSNRAGKIKENLKDLEKSMEMKRVEGVSSDPEQKNGEEDTDMDVDMDTENVVKKNESKKNKRPLSKTKKDAATKAVDKKEKRTSKREVKPCDLEAQKENMQAPIDNQSTCKKQVVKKITPKSTKAADSDDAVKAEPMCFILTGHTSQRKEYQQIIRRLKGRVCRVAHQWSYQATHFIVPDPVRRTEKFFAAAASGRWILKTDYLTASNEAGRFVAEEPYEWHKDGVIVDGQVSLEAPRKWRLLKEKTGHGAFYGMRIVIYGECISPPLDTLKRVIKAADGTILATSPPYTRFLDTNIAYAIVSPGMPHVDIWVQEFLKHEIPCISADYLVEYVCKPGYPLDKHVQFDTNAWAERSFNKLKNQLEEEVPEPGTPDSNDVACEVCGLQDRGEEMLICGDESGSVGCGAGTHIDCCDPPLDSIPEEDWFCPKCSKSKNRNKTTKRSSKKKGK